MFVRILRAFLGAGCPKHWIRKSSYGILNAMKAPAFVSVLLLCFLLSAPVYAQDSVPLRISVRDDYTRLVIGWAEDVSYTLSEQEGQSLTLRFNKPSTLDVSQADFSQSGAVRGARAVSEDPLTVELTLNRVERVRDFKIGKRIILDIYPAPSAMAKRGKSDQAPQPQKKPKAPENKTAQNKKGAKQAKQDTPQTDVKTEQKAPPAAPPAYVLVPESLPEEKAAELIKEGAAMPPSWPEAAQKAQEVPADEVQDEAIKKAVQQDMHVVSLRSAQAVGVAVFENFDALWVVTDSESAYVRPALATDQPDMFTDDFSRVPAEAGNAYRMPMPPVTLPMKGRGGALSWNVIMGDKVKEEAGIAPKRMMMKAGKGRLIWPFEDPVAVITIPDPISGRSLYVATVGNALQFSGPAQSYAEFDVLRSPVGLAIRPKVDDLRVEITENGVEVWRPGGLALVADKVVEEAQIYAERTGWFAGGGKSGAEKTSSDASKSGHSAQQPHTPSESNDPNLFKFNDWKLGPNESLNDNENLLLAGIPQKSDSRQVEDLLTLGKMFLAHGRGAEALGYFDFAADKLPDLRGSIEFLALRGVAKALDWKSESALEDLSIKTLQDTDDELKFWKSYVLADLGDWQQAAETLPDRYNAIHTYPPHIANRLALILAEVNLRDGKVAPAEELMAIVEHNSAYLPLPLTAALQYLRGEAARQKGNQERAKDIWQTLSKGEDDLYRTKAGLALTMLLDEMGEIDEEEKIDRLERLRYAWRGDELEAQVNYRLGQTYFDAGDYVKGLTIMREAAAIAEDGVLAERITSEMSDKFSNLFLGEKLKEVSPLDAVSVYEQFTELTPIGPQGDKMVQALAEHLVRADLLGRASKLLEYQINHRLEGKERARIAIRLAAIQLLDENPQQALNALGKAAEAMTFLSDSADKKAFEKEMELLRIRAYSQNGQYDKALALLSAVPDSETVHRLRADIAWQAGYWDEAAEALRAVLLDENISESQPLTKEQADLILNRAIALSLDNDRIALANMRERYNAKMAEIDYKANQFEVITRPRGNTALADRETLMSVVSEVDLFKDFLDSYREEASQ